MFWSDTKFADYIRGIEKVIINPTSDWDKWDKWQNEEAANYKIRWEEHKKSNPIRFWLAETFLLKVGLIINTPISAVIDLINYIDDRYVKKTHTINCVSNKVKPGLSYNFKKDLVLPGLTNLLIDFIEVDLAQYYVTVSNKTVREKYNVPFYINSHFRFGNWRNADAGLAELDLRYLYRSPIEESTIEEVRDLYIWWKEEYPKKCKELEEISAYHDANVDRNDLTDEEYDNIIMLSIKMNDLIDEIKKNEIDNLIRIVKVSDFFKV